MGKLNPLIYRVYPSAHQKGILSNYQFRNLTNCFFEAGVRYGKTDNVPFVWENDALLLSEQSAVLLLFCFATLACGALYGYDIYLLLCLSW